jgi:serpin B
VAKDLSEGTPVDPAIVAADNAFGLSMLKSLLQVPGVTTDYNIAIAPISLSLALQITYNGAASTTQQAMAQTLQLGSLTTQQLNDDNAALQAQLITNSGDSQLIVANSLWTNPDITVAPAFIQTSQTYYGAMLGSLAGAPDNVNQWVSQETNGLITQILRPGNYSAAAAIIANAVYFSGSWRTAFQTTQTSAQPFTLEDNSQTTVQMMHQTNTFPYLQGPGFQAVRLPYGTTGSLSMLVVSPAVGTDMYTFVSSLSAAAIDGWESQMQDEYGEVALPRFSTAFGQELQGFLTGMGMGVAFSPGEADFSGIAPMTHISSVMHMTVVRVDESGTVAAAATAVTTTTIVGQAPQFTIAMDHPFFYAIRDDKTGDLLFVGVMANPNAG